MMRSSFISRTVACGLGFVIAAVPFGSNTQALAQRDDASLKRGTVNRSNHLGATTAKAAVSISQDVRNEVDGLVERGAKRVRVSSRTGHLASAYGDLGTVTNAGASKRAPAVDDVLTYLATNAAIVGTDQPDRDLVLARQFESPIGSHFYFDQVVAGVRVFDAETAVHVDRTGHVRALTNGFAPNIEQSVAYSKSGLDEMGAREAAVASLGEMTLDADGPSGVELGIVAEGSGRLAYRVLVATLEPLDVFQVTVDAATGERIGEPRSVARYDGTAKVMVPNAVVAANNTGITDGNNSNGAVPANAYITQTLTRLSATGFLDGPAVATNRTSTRLSNGSGDFTTFQRGDAGYEAIEAYWGIELAQRYYQDVLHINNAANYQISVDAMWAPGGNQNVDNSRYVSGGGGQGQLDFGLGGVDDAEDGEIVWHEYGHATLDNQRPSIFGLEGGSIHEGWGDYLAATLSTTVPGDARFHALVGEWDATSYDFHDPTYLRRVDGNKVYPDDLNFEVHDDGEIWASVLWEIHKALGRAVADPIIFNANFLFPQDVEFADGAAALLESDQMLNGGANAAAITTALANHGLAAAQPVTPTISTVQYKGTGSKAKLVVNGQQFDADDSVVEVNGTQLAQTKHPAQFINGNVTTRVVGKNANLKNLVPKGVAVQVTVLNTSSGLRSAPFSYTR